MIFVVDLHASKINQPAASCHFALENTQCFASAFREEGLALDVQGEGMEFALASLMA